MRLLLGLDASAYRIVQEAITCRHPPRRRRAYRRDRRLRAVQVVAEAGDGEEAIAAASKHRTDVILMDIRMPTAKRHVSNQLGLRDRLQAVSYAYENGLISRRDPPIG